VFRRFLIRVSLGLMVTVALIAQEAPHPYTGERISLNLQDVNLHDFFRLIHEISGLNIVLGPDVQGSLTLVLIDVPWDQALDLVVKNYGLVAELEGNVLRVMTRETAKRELEVQKELSQAVQEAAPLRTITHRFKYARAADVAEILRRFLSPRGDIAVDERTNTLIITDVPTALERILGPLSRQETAPRRSHSQLLLW